LFALNSYSLPKCEGDDPTKWNNCEGTTTLPNGAKYVGEWKDGEMYGKGTLENNNNGTKYVGEWNNGLPDGEGTYTSPDGEQYVGGWKEGLFHGKGAYTSPDGEKYVGEFKDGDFQGQGKKAGVQEISSGAFKNISYLYLAYTLQSEHCDEHLSSKKLKKLYAELIDYMLEEQEESLGAKIDRKAVKDAAFEKALKDSRDPENGLVFSYNLIAIAGGSKKVEGCRALLETHFELAEPMINAYKLKKRKNKPKKEKRDF